MKNGGCLTKNSSYRVQIWPFFSDLFGDLVTTADLPLKISRAPKAKWSEKTIDVQGLNSLGRRCDLRDTCDYVFVGFLQVL